METRRRTQMTDDRTRWEYKHLVLNFDVTSDEGWRQLQCAGGDGWEAIGLTTPRGRTRSCC
jgi:hypothetical protein